MTGETDLFGQGWQVHFEHEFLRNGWRMHLWREAGGGRVDVAHADLTVTTHDAAVQVERSGIYLPESAYRSIVSAIDPPAHKAEVARLEDSLRLERERVDRILATVISGSDARVSEDRS